MIPDVEATFSGETMTEFCSEGGFGNAYAFNKTENAHDKACCIEYWFHVVTSVVRGNFSRLG